MFMAHIGGYDSVQVFSEDREKAKKKAVQLKRVRCLHDLEKWNWKECESYYGAWVKEIKEGTVLFDNREVIR